MAKTYQVIVATLNIRSGPGTNYEAVGTAKQGDLVSAPDLAGWIVIELEDGTLGWVSGQYLKEAQAQEETPAPATSTVLPPRQRDLTSLFGLPKDPAPYLKVLDFKEFKSDFSHVRDYQGNPWSCRIYGHKLMEAPLRLAFGNLIERGFAGEWRTYDGCLCIRKMTGGSSYSVHSWGMAIDVNAGSNGYGEEPTLSDGFVECFTDCGFTWGGSWQTPDGMHFQLPRI